MLPLLVTLAAPECVCAAAAPRMLEATYLCTQSREDLLAAAGQYTVCLAGCGRTADEATAEEMRALLAAAKGTFVLDAGGLSAIGTAVEALAPCAGRLVVTPHPGEMARLLKTNVADVQAHRLEYARSFAAEHNVTMVLKGAGTIAVSPEGKAFLNITGNPGMAKAGSGDVLAGMIASFVAQGVQPLTAAAGCVYLHGMAGDRCAQRLSKCAMLPSDMIEKLPELFLEIER